VDLRRRGTYHAGHIFRFRVMAGPQGRPHRSGSGAEERIDDFGNENGDFVPKTQKNTQMGMK
jgi:hypothetical protein